MRPTHDGSSSTHNLLLHCALLALAAFAVTNTKLPAQTTDSTSRESRSDTIDNVIEKYSAFEHYSDTGNIIIYIRDQSEVVATFQTKFDRHGAFEFRCDRGGGSGPSYTLIRTKDRVEESIGIWLNSRSRLYDVNMFTVALKGSEQLTLGSSLMISPLFFENTSYLSLLPRNGWTESGKACIEGRKCDVLEHAPERSRITFQLCIDENTQLIRRINRRISAEVSIEINYNPSVDAGKKMDGMRLAEDNGTEEDNVTEVVSDPEGAGDER